MDIQPPRGGVTRVRSSAQVRHSIDIASTSGGSGPTSSTSAPSFGVVTPIAPTSPREKHVTDRLAYKKALDRLGLDPSREKLKEQLGVQEEELRTAELQRRRAIEALIEKERHRYDAKAARDKAGAAKAFETLGYDPSKEKLMQTLGINERDFKLAELQKVQHFEEIIEQQRKRKDSKIKQDKITAAKAMEKLGYDPSKEKVKGTLGLDEEDIQDAEENKRLVHEELIQKQRERNDAKLTTDKVTGAKAFDKLGIDLSKEKVKTTLGLDDTELTLAEKEKSEYLAECIDKERVKNDNLVIKDRTVLQPALDRLGYDPSAEKLKSKLGMDDDDMETAKLQKIEVVNDLIGKEREKNDMMLSRDVRVTSKKAIDKLGYDPSHNKLKAKLGVDDTTLEAAKSEYGKPGAASPKLKKKSSASAIMPPPVMPKPSFKTRVTASVTGCLNRSSNF